MMKQLSIILFLLTATIAHAQSPFAGNWEGKLDVGPGIRVIFHITEDNGNLTATMDSPDQGAAGIAANKTEARGDSIFLHIATIGGKFSGRLADAQTLSGQLQQGPHSIALEMKRTDKTSSFNRPQTPKGPFGYRSEDVIYTTTDKSITYGATITIPEGVGVFPAILLITGSGPQNRDEELFEHKAFAVLADMLTNSGFVVLRVDDRGVGKTTGNFTTATTEDFVQDALVSLNYLQSRKEVDKKQTGLLGHSEGGLIAEIVASTRKDLAFVILNGAPGVPIPQLMVEQNEQLLQQAGLNKDMADKYIDLYKAICEATVKGQNADEAKKHIATAIKTWRAKTDAITVLATTGINNDEMESKVIDNVASEFTSPWMRKFLTYDPQTYIRNISCKVLAIGGGKDVQVIPKSNLTGIIAALQKSKSRAYDVKELEGLNHLLQTCKTCTPQEYKELEETISPLALQTIKDWLTKVIQ